MTDVVHTSTLAEVFARLEQISSYIKLQVGQPEGDGWYAHSDFARSDSPHLDAALERMQANNKSDDRQFSATAFISSYSYQFTAGGIGCFMIAKRVPDF